MKYANVSAVPLSVAVFLATDNYDHSSDPHTITATTLIKPLRQIILAARVPYDDAVVDLASMVQLRVGTAIHDGFERAWVANYQRALRTLGIPDATIDKILVNPTEDQLYDGCIPVYLEQRQYKKVGNHIVSGKFDFVGDGRLEDVKTTSTYTAMNHTNDEKHVLQGSLYRWLAPHLITRDELAIQFIFTDWSKVKAMGDPKYPQTRTLERVHQMKSIQEMQAWVEHKLALLDKHWEDLEEDIPLCTDADLWRAEPTWKYYKNPQKTQRSTRNFDSRNEALIRMGEDGNVGAIKEVPGQVNACRYCMAYSLCTQKDALIASGDLVI